jgi:hypothetical protein
VLSKTLQLASDQPRGWDSTLFWKLPAEWRGVVGFSLPVVYGAWAVGLVALYPLCAWFAALKERRRDLGWLSYL